MNKMIYTLIFCTNFFALSSCAQTKNLIVRSDAYYVIPIPGNIPVDDNGNPLELKRDTVFTVYIEAKSSGIQWEKAWKNGRYFSIIPAVIKKSKVEVGETKTENKKIVLTPQKGNTLWQLELSDDNKHQKSPQSLLSGGILLKGKWNNQSSFFHKITRLTEMASPSHY